MDDLIYIAKTNFRNQFRRFGIKTDDRRRHMYLIGKTGMGKTTVLENMMIQDVAKGNGLAVIDPHGDFVEKILNFIPSHRINDVVYINPADVDYPVAFNVLESINPAHRHLVSSGLLSVFKKMWMDSWGPRLEYILRNCILSLLEYPGSTLLGIPRILVDKPFRRKVVDKITDPIVKAFWRTEFEQYAQQFRTEAVSPIQNKIGQFLSSSLIRNIVGQPKSSLDLREIMDSHKILLLNLAKGRLGEDNAALLGGMMITKLQVAAMSRVDIPEETREDFYLYVDEFQNFATESFANILSEARKYRLNLIIAHQYIEQLDENVQAAVFGNVGTIMCFRVGATDAEELAKEFAPIFDETDLVNLAKYDVYMRLMIDGVASDPFSATTLPPITGATQNVDKVIAVSRERYANQREVVEDKIKRWSGVEEIFQGQAQSESDEREEKPKPKMEELEPIVKDTGDEISLSQALAMTQPRSAQRAAPKSESVYPLRPEREEEKHEGEHKTSEPVHVPSTHARDIASERQQSPQGLPGESRAKRRRHRKKKHHGELPQVPYSEQPAPASVPSQQQPANVPKPPEHVERPQLPAPPQTPQEHPKPQPRPVQPGQTITFS